MGINVNQINTTANTKARKQASAFDFLNKDIKFGNGMNDKKKQKFYSELSMLLSAGIDLRTALEISVSEGKKQAEKELMKEVADKVLGGSSLSEALHATGKFSEYEYYSLKIGEESSRLDDVLTDLANFFDRKIEQKRKLINTFSYPLIVMVMAIGAIAFMLNFIVPMFEDVFKRFDGDLPALTQWIINLSDWMADYGLMIVLVILASILALYLNRNQPWFRSIGSAILLRLPVAGELTAKIYLSRFCHSMHLLTVSKNPLLSSIQLVKKMVAFYPLEQALTVMEDDILHGKSLNDSMRQFPIFNSRMITLVKVAEEVNQLDMIFGQLNKNYTEEITHQTAMLGNLLEPILILMIGGFVAVILVAMYLPLFQLSTSVF